jgi:hypothetical protein
MRGLLAPVSKIQSGAEVSSVNRNRLPMGASVAGVQAHPMAVRLPAARLKAATDWAPALAT